MIVHIQRVRGDENRAERRLLNGPPRVQSKVFIPSILQRECIRKLPEICLYLAKSTVNP